MSENKTEEKAITRAPLAFEPANIDDAWRLAGMLAKSNLLPDALRQQPENVLVTLMAGRELGLSPMQSVRMIYVVKGQPRLSSALKIAMVKGSQACKYFRCTNTTSEQATFETERRDEGVTSLTFTIADAKRAGLLDQGKNPSENNWAKYPAHMLRWRAGAALADIVYPDVVGGFGTIDPGESPQEIEKGFLERVVPEVSAVTAPPVPPKTEETKPERKMTVIDEAETVTEPASPSEGAPQDPLEIELVSIAKGIEAAQSRKELQTLVPRIMALPETERKTFHDVYSARTKALPMGK